MGPIELEPMDPSRLIFSRVLEGVIVDHPWDGAGLGKSEASPFPFLPEREQRPPDVAPVHVATDV